MAVACRFVDNDTAQDIVQDLFIWIYENKDYLDNKKDLPSYLFKFIQNNCLNHLRHQSIAADYKAEMEIAAERIEWYNNKEANNTLNTVINTDLIDRINEAVNQLPPRCAEAFRLCYFHDLKHKEIADIMKVSSRTVENHIHKALKYLRTKLKYIFFVIFLFFI